MNNRQINKDKHTFQNIGTQQQAYISLLIYIKLSYQQEIILQSNIYYILG